MALEGELSGFNGVNCSECGNHLELEILSTPAGYYLGYFCNKCGPYSRETGYFETREKAEKELEFMKKGDDCKNKRDTEYHPDEYIGITTQCTFDPTVYKDQPIGMFHCPLCGEMVMAGLPHPVPMSNDDWNDYFSFVEEPKNEHDWELVWLTDDLEGFRCKNCGEEAVDIEDYTRECRGIRDDDLPF